MDRVEIPIHIAGELRGLCHVDVQDGRGLENYHKDRVEYLISQVYNEMKALEIQTFTIVRK